MRRNWPFLVAVIPLVFGGILAAAHPAAAQARPAGSGTPEQPGGPIRFLSQPRAATGGTNTVVSSSNWAGYAATGTFTSVSSNWTQPAAQCVSGLRYAAFWVGLDGYSSSTVEQTGTEVDCNGRLPRYYAWYEMYPGRAVNFADPVSAGDLFNGSVTYQGNGRFRLVLTDTTKNWSRTVNATLPAAARSSAEVIAEAPCCTYFGKILPLANFGTASFSGAMANGTSMSAHNPVEITMPDTSVSSMSGGGNFAVRYTGFSASYPWPSGS